MLKYSGLSLNGSFARPFLSEQLCVSGSTLSFVNVGKIN